MDKFLTHIDSTLCKEKQITLYLKRDDLLHPLISGNKYRKLKYVLEKAQDFKGIISFGGAYSNHIYSLAAAGMIHDIPTVGLIRGDETKELNATLSFAQKSGMKLEFVSREKYRKRNDRKYLTKISEQYPGWLIVPEGGTNIEGVKGCEEILSDISINYDFVCVPVGSAGTISGLINSIKNNEQVLGFPALKNVSYLKDVITGFVGKEKRNWGFIEDYHFGGYAKMKPVLKDFILDFKIKYDVLLDPIYNGKMLYGVFDLIKKDFFQPNSTIICIHTGGLQGWSGIDPEMLK